MEVPEEAKDMVGNSYLFSGNYLDKKDRKEQEHFIKDVKMTDTFIKNKKNKPTALNIKTFQRYSLHLIS